MTSRWGWALLAALGLLVSSIAEYRRYGTAPLRHPVPLKTAKLAVATAVAPAFRLVERSSTTIPMPPGVPAAHASALAALPNGDLLACWWAGQRESAPDVRVYIARWRDGRWGPARAIVDRQSLGAALDFGIRRIGNPVLWVSGDGHVHLYLVATGLGGWAAGRVAQLVSTDSGERFTARRILPLTPLFNTSVLVRTQPVGVADGGWLLPAYFELGNKFPMVVSFSANGEPRWVQRIGESRTTLQPALLPLSATELRAVMRDVGPERRVQQAVSHDAGLTWEDIAASELANHDNSLAGLQLVSGGYVLLHNEAMPAGQSPRQWLRLSMSLDGKVWRPGPDVRRGVENDEFSYPSLVQIGRELHVTYTQQRRAIAHHVYEIRYDEVPP